MCVFVRRLRGASQSPRTKVCLIAATPAATVHLAVAVGAVYGARAAWHERHLGFFTTIGANNLRHRALAAVTASIVSAPVATAVTIAV